MDYVKIDNDGQKIVSTNFWETEYALNGYCYLSINAGCYRLLVPKFHKDWLDEIKKAKEVVLSRGPARNLKPPKSDALEIMFEDHTEEPFVITISPEQMDRMPTDADGGWKGFFDIYYLDAAEPVQHFDRVYYRKVKELPCMKAVK